MKNSVNELVIVLKHNPFLTENELFFKTWGYDRNSSYRSNKKYADMLRRALLEGKVSRISANVHGKQATFFYYIPASPIYNRYKQQLVLLRNQLKTKFPDFKYTRIFTEQRKGGNIRSKFWYSGMDEEGGKDRIVKWVNRNKKWNKLFKAELYNYATCYGPKNDIVIKSIS